MSLLESGENYLETILVLTKRNGSVRSIDIAEEMNFTKASVSRAMSILKRDNYIIMEPDGRILLTKDGQKKAAAVYDRHVTLTRFINEILGVDEEIAEKDACPISILITICVQSKKFISPRLIIWKESSHAISNRTKTPKPRCWPLFYRLQADKS